MTSVASIRNGSIGFEVDLFTKHGDDATKKSRGATISHPGEHLKMIAMKLIDPSLANTV